MKGSEVHKMVAAVLEVMEKAQFESQVNVNIEESDDPSRWMMSFLKKTTSLNELEDVKNELGENFTIKVAPRDKSSVTVVLEAPSTAFIGLLKV